LEPLRSLHPVGEPAVDLDEELVDERLRRDLLEHTTVRIDEADVASARDAEVRVTRLPRSVHRAAHDRDLERLRVCAQAILDDAREALDTDVVPSTRRTCDHHGPSLAQPERLENLPGDLDLSHRIGGERHPHRVADAV